MHDCFIFTTQKLVLSTGMLVYFIKGQKYRILKSLNRPTEISSSYHRVVNSPSTPTGPRAWIRLVLIPTYTAIEENQIQENDLDILTKFYRTAKWCYTSAPSPNRAPSQNLVLALWKTAALPTNTFIILLSSWITE